MKQLLIWTVLVATLAAVSCRSTKKIQTAIAPKDSTAVVAAPAATWEDSLRYIRTVYDDMQKNRIDFGTFSAKVNVDYVDADDKKYNVNANLRMQKDSAIWISVNAIFGIEALRVLITKDSVKLLNKQDKEYVAKPISYLQETTSLPLDLHILQDMLIGNPVFVDPKIISYSKSPESVSLLSIGSFFKNLVTLTDPDYLLLRIKLDDLDINRNRTGDLTYSDYEKGRGVSFATKRKITIAERKKLDIRMEYKQYSFNEPLTFPFSIPKNYTRN